MNLLFCAVNHSISQLSSVHVVLESAYVHTTTFEPVLFGGIVTTLVTYFARPALDILLAVKAPDNYFSSEDGQQPQ
jgi:hypothetical protein